MHEIAGFLCRWLLLAAAGAGALVVGGAALRATGLQADEVRVEIALSDGVARWHGGRREAAVLRGLVRPARARSAQLVLAAAPLRPLTLGWAGGERCAAYVDRPVAGVMEVVVRGVPYGAAAFQSHRRLLAGVPDARPVLLLDARLAQAEAARRPDQYRRCAGAMKATFEVLLFHVGDVAAYGRARAELRAAGVAEPVFYDARRTDPVQMLVGAAAELGRRPPRPGVELATADPELARRAAEAGFLTHLVAAPAPSPAPRAALRLHESLTKLKESLEARPIP